MRLDPQKVKFSPSGFDLGILRVPIRFAGKGCTLQLLETALVIEGNVLKVGLLGVETVFFRAALSEWSVLTVPYSRILRIRQPRFSVIRLLGLILMILCLGFGINMDLLTAIFVILPGMALGLLLITTPQDNRIKLKFRRADESTTTLVFRIRSKALRIEFMKKMEEYRRGASRFGGPPSENVSLPKGAGK